VRLANGTAPRARREIVDGLEAFAPLFVAVLLAALGVALGLLLIVPGVYLAIRWFFVSQAVVLEGRRGPEALTASAAAVQGNWWRTAGIVLLANLAALLPGLLLTVPFIAIADAADRQLWVLVGNVATEVVAAPFVALLATLLWFDLQARRA
jgi:hypothetical protein